MKIAQSKFKLACACAVLLMVGFSTAQQNPSRETDVENSRANTALIVEDIRPKLFGDLPPAERAIYDQIHFSVSSDDKIMNAYATRRGGVRRVVLTEAIGRATELNTDAFLMEQLYHMDGFLGKYMNFICERYQKNYKRYAQGLSAERIPSPYEFAHWSDRDLQEFYSDKDVNKARNIAVGAAFSFLLAHEVAHHIKGHVDSPTSDLSQRREQESEADAWAIDLLVKKKLNPVDGIIPLLFFYFTDQNPVSKETMNDHPADARRLLRMYEGLAERLPSFRPYLRTDYDTARKQVDLAISLVRSEIAAGERQRSNTPSGSVATGSHSFAAGGGAPALCEDLNAYIESAANNFRSLRGAPDPDGEGEAFVARRGIAGFSDCTVWIYRDRSLEPAASCDAERNDIDGLRSSVQACLGQGSSSTTRNGEYIFEQRNGVSVRIRPKTGHKPELWVDAPSRD